VKVLAVKTTGAIEPNSKHKNSGTHNACQKVKRNTRATVSESTLEGTLEMCNKSESCFQKCFQCSLREYNQVHMKISEFVTL